MLNRKGQNFAEYAILIALVVAAALAMQVYVKRGLQGRVADAVDHAPAVNVAGQALNFTTRQYEPYYTQSTAQVATTTTSTDTLGARGQTGRTSTQTTTRTGATELENWVGFQADSNRQ